MAFETQRRTSFRSRSSFTRQTRLQSRYNGPISNTSSTSTSGNRLKHEMFLEQVTNWHLVHFGKASHR